MGERTASGREEQEGGGETPALDAPHPTKRERLVRAMLEAVGESGYETVSVRTVLGRTGIYRQAFYDSFEGKSDCYLSALDAGIAHLERLLGGAAAGESGWRGRLRAGLAALLEFLEEEPEIGRALVVEIHSAGPEALKKRAAQVARLTAFVDRARQEPGCVSQPAAIAPEAVVAGIYSVVYSRLSTRTGGLRELLPELMYFAVLPYFGAEGAEAEMRGGGA